MLQPLREAEKVFEFLEIELRTKGRRIEDIGFQRRLTRSSAIDFHFQALDRSWDRN